MGDGVGGHPRFTSWSGTSFPWGAGDTSTVRFGGNVLDGVVTGLQEFLDAGDWRMFRRTPAVLGCSPWLSDSQVVDELMRFTDCCVVTGKDQSVNPQLRRLHDDGPRFLLDSLRAFDHLAPRVDGEPLEVGPYTPREVYSVASVRVAGVGREAPRQVLPHVHPKMLVVGTVHESDEHPAGVVSSWKWFVPERVWLGSANLTANSRRGLEFGLWSDDPQLAKHATGFLTDLLTYSEPLGSPATRPDPEYDGVTFDDEAMREAAAALFGDAPDDDPADGQA